MNIERVTVEVLETPVESQYTAAGNQVSTNYHVLARIFTGGGVQGIGFDVGLRPTLVKSLAQTTQELGQLLIGMSVLEIEAARAKLERASGWAGPGGLVNMAMAPLDIAMWDAKGKILGQPLHRLLGGYRDRVRAYASDSLWYSLPLARWYVLLRTTLLKATTWSKWSNCGWDTKLLLKGRCEGSKRSKKPLDPKSKLWWTLPRVGIKVRRWRLGAHYRRQG